MTELLQLTGDNANPPCVSLGDVDCQCDKLVEALRDVLPGLMWFRGETDEGVSFLCFDTPPDIHGMSVMAVIDPTETGLWVLDADPWGPHDPIVTRSESAAIQHLSAYWTNTYRANAETPTP